MAMTIADIITRLEADIKRDRDKVEVILSNAKAEGRSNLTEAEDARCESLMDSIDASKQKLARAKAVEDEENQSEKRLDTLTRNPGPMKRSILAKFDEIVRIGEEPHTYSPDRDPKGSLFLTDVASAFRGNAQANERLARHMREYATDNPKYQERAVGDTAVANLPNLVVPQYLINEYAAKATNARPFADICRHVDLPAQGMKVELAKANTATTAALQTTELVAVSPGNFDLDPLELSVQTAEDWALCSRQALERGAITEQVVLNDMLDSMHSLIDSTLITQATTGLYDSGTRITYDSASPKVDELYPYILQGASKSAQTLLNKGKPTHVLMHPRRWYWMQSLVGSTWPMIQQPGMAPQNFGANNGGGYEDGGVLPCGLKVVQDANVQTAALAGAQTGGTQDILYIVPQSECILLEAPNREVFIRAEAPAASQLGVMLVVYEYFAYTFSRYASTAMQRINGTGTVPPTGF